ncbi:hypothetical protein ElyMa_003945800 [Elysia marginata]|uniref:Uncharacterized protein n=1 Tax=Elysia marginata TaxID=1093978 RepID=A0AAV4FSP1_9GAST|nr:hypothetical protein ElyMa_003945800 [Elysia marginata]
MINDMGRQSLFLGPRWLPTEGPHRVMIHTIHFWPYLSVQVSESQTLRRQAVSRLWFRGTETIAPRQATRYAWLLLVNFSVSPTPSASRLFHHGTRLILIPSVV